MLKKGPPQLCDLLKVFSSGEGQSTSVNLIKVPLLSLEKKNHIYTHTKCHKFNIQ